MNRALVQASAIFHGVNITRMCVYAYIYIYNTSIHGCVHTYIHIHTYM
jgi:hypothetical protein